MVCTMNSHALVWNTTKIFKEGSLYTSLFDTLRTAVFKTKPDSREKRCGTKRNEPAKCLASPERAKEVNSSWPATIQKVNQTRLSPTKPHQWSPTGFCQQHQ